MKSLQLMLLGSCALLARATSKARSRSNSNASEKRMVGRHTFCQKCDGWGYLKHYSWNAQTKRDDDFKWNAGTEGVPECRKCPDCEGVRTRQIRFKNQMSKQPKRKLLRKPRSKAGKALNFVGKLWKAPKTVGFLPQRIGKVPSVKRRVFDKQLLEDDKKCTEKGFQVSFRIPYHPSLACSTRRGTKFTKVVKGGKRTAPRPFFVAGNYVQLSAAQKQSFLITKLDLCLAQERGTLPTIDDTAPVYQKYPAEVFFVKTKLHGWIVLNLVGYTTGWVSRILQAGHSPFQKAQMLSISS